MAQMGRTRVEDVPGEQDRRRHGTGLVRKIARRRALHPRRLLRVERLHDGPRVFNRARDAGDAYMGRNQEIPPHGQGEVPRTHPRQPHRIPPTHHHRQPFRERRRPRLPQRTGGHPSQTRWCVSGSRMFSGWHNGGYPCRTKGHRNDFSRRLGFQCDRDWHGERHDGSILRIAGSSSA